MGTIGIDNIEDKIEDLEFKELVGRQRDEYQDIMDRAIDIFMKYGKDEKAIGTMPKIMSYIMVNAKTMTDHSVNILAKMMIEGSNKGIIEIQEQLNAETTDDKEIINLAEKLLKTEQHNLEDLKPFL